VPEGARSGLITTPDGTRLRYARWPSIPAQARGTICLVHGRTEFIEKYFETVNDLRRRGFAVATFDFRGQGGSDRMLRNPRKGHVDRFEDYEQDLETFMRKVALPDCPPPLYGLGHSTGGNVLLLSANRMRTRMERIVVTAPLVRLARAPFRPGLLRAITGTLSFLGFGGFYAPGSGSEPQHARSFTNNPLTSDIDRYRLVGKLSAAAPELTIGGPTIHWVYAACVAMDRLEARGFGLDIHVPILMVAGGIDPVISRQSIERLADRMKSAGQVLVAGARHEVLMERDELRDQFWAAFDAFIPGTPTATSNLQTTSDGGWDETPYKFETDKESRRRYSLTRR